MFPFSSRRRAPLARGVALALLIAALVPALVMAQEQPARIDIRPVPASASGYFELALEPGSTHELTVEIGNYGAEPAEAHTYAAGVYSLINGGMGVDLAGEAITGATTWLSYAPETFILAGQQAVHRTFTVTVPADAPPGEYLTSIVVEGNPTLASGSGGAVINQVVRKAIAVSISIAGPRRSALEIGAATHHVVASKSVVRIELLNRGNVRVGPEGRFALRDSAGAQITEYDVDMATIFAGTATTLEVPFDGLLPPGLYTINLTLADAAAELSVVTAAIPLDIVLPDGADSAAPAPTPRGPAAITLPTPAAGASSAAAGPALPDLLWPLLAFAGLLAALAPLLLRRRRR